MNYRVATSLTPEVLQKIVPRLDDGKAQEVAEALTPAMEWADISTPTRLAAFIAQVAHESGGFRYMRELGPDSYFDRYEGREDLGNTEPGDGLRFKGRGYIQITGRDNYTQAGADLELDLVNQPEMAETPQVAAYIAAWFWNNRNLNRFADSGDFITLTRRINGGLNGLAERQAYWARAKEALGAA